MPPPPSASFIPVPQTYTETLAHRSASLSQEIDSYLDMHTIFFRGASVNRNSSSVTGGSHLRASTYQELIARVHPYHMGTTVTKNFNISNQSQIKNRRREKSSIGKRKFVHEDKKGKQEHTTKTDEVTEKQVQQQRSDTQGQHEEEKKYWEAPHSKGPAFGRKLFKETKTYGSRKSAGTGGAWSRFSFGGTSACYGEKITLSKVQEEDNENEEDDSVFNIPIKQAEEQQNLNEEVLEINHAGTSKDIIEASKTKSIQGKSALAKEKHNQENLKNQEECTESVRGKEEGGKSENGALDLEGGSKVRRGEKRKKNGRRGDKKSERLSEMPKSAFEDAKQEDAVCMHDEERSVAHWSPLSGEGDGKHEGEDEESAASLPVEVKTKVDRVDTSSRAAISKARSIPSRQAATQNIRAAGTRNGHKTTIMRVEVSPTTENPFTSPKESWPNSSLPSAKQFPTAFPCMSATKMREQDLCALVSPLAPISGNVVKSKGGRGLERYGLDEEGDRPKIASAVANTAEWMQKEMEKDIEMRFKETEKKGRGKQDTGRTALKATAQSTRKGNVLRARAGGGGKKVLDEKTEQLVKRVKVFRDVDLRVITKKGTRDETMTVHGTRGVDKQVDSVQEEGGRDSSTEGRGISPSDRREKGSQKKVRRSGKEKRPETQQAVKTRQEQISRGRFPCGRAPEKMFTAMFTKQRQNAGPKKMSVSGMEAKTKSNASLGIWRRTGMGGEMGGFNTSLERLALGDEEDMESVSEEDTG